MPLYATAANPSGCLNDLFSVGGGHAWAPAPTGKPQPAGFNDLTTGEGSTALGFYNVHEGDAPYLKTLADNYAMSDNFHQAVQGGTGANHVMLGTGDAVWYSDGKGNADDAAGEPRSRTPIRKPAPTTGTRRTATALRRQRQPIGGGSYSNCSDSDQPGVGAVLSYLPALPASIDPRTARRATTTCSTTTRPATSATAPSTPAPSTRSPSRRRPFRRSATRSDRRTCRSRTSATSSTATWRTRTSRTRPTSTATSATSSSTHRRS